MQPIEQTKKPNICIKPPFFKNLELVYSKPIMILLLIFLPYFVAFIIGNKYILPFITSIPASIVLFRHLKNSKPFIAVLDMLLYVFWLSVIGIVLMTYFSERAEHVILNGKNYVAEMSSWLFGEASKEGSPSLFIPEHLTHMVIVAVSSLISCGFLALLFGTVLMNYMNYYVSVLIIMTGNPILSVIGWHPWSVLRVISFIILGCALAWFLTSKITGSPKPRMRAVILMLMLSIILEAADIILKTTIGSIWRDLILSFFGLVM